MKPAIALTNAGVDTNVFNDSSPAAAKSDFRFTVTPSADLWLHVGRLLLSGTIREDIVWYQQYASERSVNNLNKLGVVVPLNRLVFNGSVSYLNTRDRPGFEIDGRVGRREVGYDGAVEVQGLSRTFIGVHSLRQTVRFDEGAMFAGVNLHDELSRETTSNGVTLRYQVTELTGILIEVSRARDRFDFRPSAGSKSTEATIGVKFDPAALLKGTATFGYRRFIPDDPSLPSYSGPTNRVGLSYVFAGSTKLTVEAVQAVQYSFDPSQPYYLQSGVSGSMAQQIFGPVDVAVRAGVQHLAYRNKTGAVAIEPGRTDRVHTYGLGIGYHFGEDLRMGVDADHDNRQSKVVFRNYDGWRIGAAITYGM